MFKGFLIVGLFSTIFCTSLEFLGVKPELVSHTQKLNEDVSGQLNLLQSSNPPKKCETSPIILKTLHLIMSILNQKMEQQAHTTYILNLLIKVIEKSTEGFSLREQEVMYKVLEALESYQGPTLQPTSVARIQRSSISDGRTRLHRSYCADALLKISQIATDAYKRLISESLETKLNNGITRSTKDDYNDNYPYNPIYNKDFAHEDAESTTRRQKIKKEIFDYDSHSLKPQNEISVVQYKYPSNKDTLQIEINTGFDIDMPTATPYVLHNYYKDKPYTTKTTKVVENVPGSLTSDYSSSRSHWTQSTIDRNKNTEDPTLSNNYKFNHNDYNIMNWQPEFVNPIKDSFYLWELESSTYNPNDYYYDNYYPQGIVTYKNAPIHDDSLLDKSKAQLNSEHTSNMQYLIKQNDNTDVHYDIIQNYWPHEVEVTTEIPLYDDNIYWNHYQDQINAKKPAFFHKAIEYQVPVHDHISVNPNQHIENNIVSYDENRNIENDPYWEPFSNPFEHEYVSIEDLTGPDNDKFWAYETYLWNMGKELPEIQYSNIPSSQVTDAYGSYNPETSDVQFVDSFPENVYGNSKNLMEPVIENHSVYSYNQPIPIEDEIDSSSEPVSKDRQFIQNAMVGMISKIQDIYEKRPSTPSPYHNQKSDQYWPYHKNPSESEMENDYYKAIELNLDKDLFYNQPSWDGGNHAPMIQPLFVNRVDNNPNQNWLYNQNLNQPWPYDQNSFEIKIEVSPKKFISGDNKGYSHPGYNLYNYNSYNILPFYKNPSNNELMENNFKYSWPKNKNPSDYENEVTTKKYISVDYDVDSNPADFWPYGSNSYSNYFSTYNQNPSKVEIEVTTEGSISFDQLINSNYVYNSKLDYVNEEYIGQYEPNPSEIEIEVTTNKYFLQESKHEQYSTVVPMQRPDLILNNQNTQQLPYKQNSGNYISYNHNPDYGNYDQNNIFIGNAEESHPDQYEVLIRPFPINNNVNYNSSFNLPYDIDNNNLKYFRPNVYTPSSNGIEVTTKSYSDEYKIGMNPFSGWMSTQRPGLVYDDDVSQYDKYWDNSPYNQNSGNAAYDQSQSELETETTTKGYVSDDYLIESNIDYWMPVSPKTSAIINYYDNKNPDDLPYTYYRPYNPSVYEIESTTSKYYISTDNTIDSSLNSYRPYDYDLHYYENSEVTKKRNNLLNHLNNHPSLYNWLFTPTVKPVSNSKNPSNYLSYDQQSKYNLLNNQNPSEIEMEMDTKKHFLTDHTLKSMADHWQQNPSVFDGTTKTPKSKEYHKVKESHQTYNSFYDEGYYPKRPVLIEEVMQAKPIMQDPATSWSKTSEPQSTVTTPKPITFDDSSILPFQSLVTTKRPKIVFSELVGYSGYNDSDQWDIINTTNKDPKLNHYIGNDPNNHWNYGYKQWNYGVNVPAVKHTANNHLGDANAAYIYNENKYWINSPETSSNKNIYNYEHFSKPGFSEHKHSYFHQPNDVPEKEYVALDEINGPYFNQFQNHEGVVEKNYIVIPNDAKKDSTNEHEILYNPSSNKKSSEALHITSDRPTFQYRPPDWHDLQSENYNIWNLYKNTSPQTIPSNNPVLTDFNYYPWGHNVKITTEPMTKYNNNYPKAIGVDSQLELQNDKWKVKALNNPSILVNKKEHFVHKPNGYNIDENDEMVNSNINPNTDDGTEIKSYSSAMAFNGEDSIYLNSGELVNKPGIKNISAQQPSGHKLVTSPSNDQSDGRYSKSEYLPSWSLAENGALILTDPIEIPSNYANSDEVLTTRLNDLDIDDKVETETLVLQLIKYKLNYVEQRAKVAKELRILNMIKRIRQIINEADVTKEKYLEVLKFYNAINDYLKAKSGQSKVNYMINLLYNLPDHKNLELDSQNNVVEMTYLVRRPKPIVIYPYYFIKYKVPVEKIDKLVKENPDIIDDDKLHVKLLKTSEISDKSPALQRVSDQDLLELTVDHGEVIDTKLISGFGDSKILYPEDFEDINTVFRKELLKQKLRSTPPQKNNTDGKDGETIHLTIKQNSKPYDTISIEDKHFPLEKKQEDKLNDLQNPLRKIFPLYKLEKATADASALSRQGVNEETSINLNLKPLSKLDSKHNIEYTTSLPSLVLKNEIGP